jgi:hypothetical protein
MTKRDEAFADLPTIALVKGDANFHALLSPPEGYDGPCWTAHFIGPHQNEVAAEIKRRWDGFDAMRKALEVAVELFECDDECQTTGTDACMWLFDARAALRLAEEGERG